MDNSTRIVDSAKIRLICMKEGVKYHKVPANEYSGLDPSMSHGFALNYAYENFCKSSDYEFFGFLDHDIFPAREYSIISKLNKQGMYGLKQERKNRWYLWPGFCFFSTITVSIDLDFMPSENMDTGGGNWSGLYSYVSPASMDFPDYSIKRVGAGSSKQKDKYEVIDKSWLHLVNASNWANVDMAQKFSNLDILLSELANK